MTQIAETPPNVQRHPLLRNLPLIVIAVVAVTGAIFLRDFASFDTLREHREALLAFRDNHYALMVLAFIACYVVIVAFSLPGAAVASVTGGFLFGLFAGTLFNVTAATIGASLIFMAARLGLGETLSARFDASTGAMKKVHDGLRENELSVLFLMRLVPAVPFFVANLLPAMVGVRFGRFVFTTFFGIIPGGIAFTWIGVGVGQVFDRGETPDLSLLWEPHVIGPVAALCVLAAMPIVIRAIQRRRGSHK